MKNRVKEIFRRKDGLAFGTVAQLITPEGAEIAAKAGFDFVVVDTEHTYFGLETSVNHFRAIEAGGATPIIRLPDDDPIQIAKALDAGAHGILIPRVSTKKQAETVVRAVRYAPKGDRGMCPSVRGSGMGVTPWPEFRKFEEEEILVILLIETVEGVNNAEEIASVDGVDVLALGPYDLSCDMGLDGQVNHPDVVANMKKTVAAARKYGKEAFHMTGAYSPETLKATVDEWLPLGVRMFNYSSDSGAIALQYAMGMKAIKNLTGRQ